MFYPDPGEPLEDKAILRNAVEFATTQRAWRAMQTLRQPLDTLTNLERAILGLEGFESMATSLEDIQGWNFVFQEWKPGTSEGGLFALLDKVQVGRQQS